MRNINLLILIVALVGTGCVQNKKVLYLQHGELDQKTIAKDSLLRKYNIEKYNYRIQPQDILYVTFESLTPAELDFFSKGAANRNNINLQAGGGLIIGEVVDNDGMIPLPVVGKVKVGGQTIFEAQETLQTLASQFFDSPKAKVRLLNFHVTLLGEVNQEGNIGISQNRATILEVIGLAGGLTDIADRANVKLVRQIGDQVSVQYINLLDENLILSPYYYIHQNDVLIVPPLKQRPFRKYFGQNLSVIISSISLLLLVINLSR